jgi:uncharacterized protein YdhG (YjbR/CyaY superfamily)
LKRANTAQETRSVINAYLASQPAEARSALRAIRGCIQELAPEAEEVMSYGLPGFKVGGRSLVSYGGFKGHCSLFPGADAIRTHARELRAYEIAKGTIRFSPKAPLPLSLVRKLLRPRLAELRAAAPRRGARSSTASRRPAR